MKKTKSDLDYDLMALQIGGDFRIFYDGDDWGIFKYKDGKYINEENPFPFSMEEVIRAVKDNTWFIQATAVREDK